MHEQLIQRLAGAGLTVDPAIALALGKYLAEIGRWNRTHNLTAITRPEAMIDRHVMESLALRPLLEGRRIADVGSGAGVPGVPLAIIEPDRHFTLIESRRKRVAFLRHVQGVLGLVNVHVEHGRVEAMNNVGTFDTLLAKAVAPPWELLRLTVHLFKPDTVMLVPTSGRLAGESLDVDKRFDIRPVDEAILDQFGGSLLRISRKPGVTGP